MTARHTFTLVTIALALSAVALVVGISRPVQAQANRKCVWSYLTDGGAPNIGKDGKGDITDASWKAMSDGGWEFKQAFSITGDTAYLFERCQ